MGSTALVLVSGVPRQQTITTSLPLIYDQTVSVVSSGGTPPSSINGPISAGTAVTLPGSETYTLNTNSVANLQIYLNGDRLEQTLDWTTSGSGPNYTAVQFTFQLNALDVLVFRIERSS
jgi:hypothetical protein